MTLPPGELPGNKVRYIHCTDKNGFLMAVTATGHKQCVFPGKLTRTVYLDRLSCWFII